MTDTADTLTADELDQLAQSLAIDAALGRADTLKVVEVLRELARSLVVAAQRAHTESGDEGISVPEGGS
jgi:hypothetical protein